MKEQSIKLMSTKKSGRSLEGSRERKKIDYGVSYC